MSQPSSASLSISSFHRTEELFREQWQTVCRRTDLLFAGLLIFEWLVALVLFATYSRQAWTRIEGEVHSHLFGSIVLSGFGLSIPLFLIWAAPGQAITRHSVAVGQMLYSAVLIHLTAGRLESHFLIFGSLTFLAFYRDWKVVITASLVVVVDHYLRGLLWPVSIYGSPHASDFRWLEHTLWVGFLDLFLIRSCLVSISEMFEISLRRARLEGINQEIEKRIQDRTRELRESESQLRRLTTEAAKAKAQLSDAVESLDAGFVMMDAEERLVTCNERFKQLYPQMAAAFVPGRRYEEIIRGFFESGHGTLPPGKTLDETVQARMEALRHPGPPVEQFFDEKWILLNEHRMKNGGTVSLRTDITHLKQIQQELRVAKETAEAASRLKSEILANMSHEIRTPLNGIIGMTELTLETSLSPTQREYLELVRTSAESLLVVINDILDFSKIEAGKLDLDPIDFDLHDMLADTLKSFALRADGKKLELILGIGNAVPKRVRGDLGRLRQILVNLVGNAIKFTEQGEIVVRVDSQPGTSDPFALQFSVRDTGIGIPPEKRARIFAPFEQADGSMTRRYGGTGLGLSISQRLVEMMQGKLSLESEVGQGSCFSFSARLAAPEAGVDLPYDHSPDLAERTVLIVDDNSTNRRILFELLRGWGMNPTAVGGGHEAVAELQTTQEPQSYDLILLDAMMPEMDGFELAQRIREQSRHRMVPLVMLSSGHPRDAERCQAHGIDLFLSKPIKQSDLFDAIIRVLRPIRTERRRETRMAEAESVPLPKLRILLAEDHPVNQKLATTLLKKQGHEVVVASNGRLALEQVQLQPFDLVLMDLQMPEMDGFETTARIREWEATSSRRVRIIALTAHAMKGDRERCLDSGMDGYVSKPIRVAELNAELARFWSPVCESSRVSEGPELQKALEFVEGDRELFRELIQLFLDDSPRLLNELQQAIESKDAKTTQRAAHTLKGTLLNFDAIEAAECARRIEACARECQLEEAGPICTELIRTLTSLEMTLKRWSAEA